MPNSEDQSCIGMQAPQDFHGVSVVAYYTDEEGRLIVTIQNSWGVEWGCGGFANILINAKNPLKIFDFMTTPVVSAVGEHW